MNPAPPVTRVELGIVANGNDETSFGDNVQQKALRDA